MDAAELISQVNIVEYISQYVDLEKKNDEWWGLSPFKVEKTPSFSVREDPPFFYDYSAGVGGNVFKFIQLYFNCSSAEVFKRIKDYLGITDEDITYNKKLSAVSVSKKYSTKKPTTKKFSGTNLRPDCMRKYEKRDDKLQVWINEGISRETLDKFQVYYDPFSDRLVYPIYSIDGNIVNIGGRTLDPDFKEKNQRKYCYFYKWGTINTIYGLYENREAIEEKKEIILFEGCKSVLLADTWGIHNTGAILTSHLSESMITILAKFGYDVVFALDKDVDIRKDKNIQRLKRYVKVYYLYDSENVLDEKDSPVDKGKNEFQRIYKSRRLV